MDTLKVSFDRVRWAADPDEDNLKWGIYVVRVDDKKTIIKGKLDPDICQFDMEFNVVGKWVNDNKYGRQFQFQSYSRVEPGGKWGTMAFLMQAEGIGEVNAGKIYDEYEEGSIKEVIDFPDVVSRQCNINLGIMRAAADKLRPIIGEMKTKMPLLDLFKGTRISAKTADRIIKAKWNDPVARLKANPFILSVFSGIAFKQCDSLRIKLRLPKDMPERITAACKQSFYDKSDQTWLTTKQVRDTMSMLLELREFGIDEAIQGLLNEKVLTQSEEFSVDGLLGLSNEVRDEQYVAQNLYQRMATPGNDWPIEEILADRELSDHQKDVIVHNMEVGGRLIILSGSPGTGKTFCLGKIIKYFCQRNGCHEHAAAPTGKAAQRLSESLADNGVENKATTIHRMLEPLPVDGGWVFQIDGKTNFVDAKLVAIDETSMLNNWLGARALKGVRNNSYVILVGDKNQLPPVGPGTILRDLEELQFKSLKEIRRNSGKIVSVCAKIRDGKAFNILPTKTPGANSSENNLQLVLADKDESKAKKVVDIAKLVLDGKFDGVNDPLRDVQFLTATHKNAHIGREKLNLELQSMFNPSGKGEHPFYKVGDKIICTENSKIKRDGEMTEEFIANGELGYVVESKKKQIIVKMNGTDGQFVVNCGAELGNGWDLGYAITTHKSQGSEWQWAVTVLGSDYGSSMVMCREWVYTAFSRGKVGSIVVATPALVRTQVKKIRIWDRKSLILNHMELISERAKDEGHGVPMGANL